MEKIWLKNYDKGVPFSLEYPIKTIPEILDNSASKFPKKTLAIFYGRSITYEQIKRMSDAFAVFLRKKLNIKEGEKVALLLPNFPGFIIAYYGILKAQATAVLLNPLYTESELRYQMSDSGVKGVVTIPMFSDKLYKISEDIKLDFSIIMKMSKFMGFPANLVFSFKELQVNSSLSSRMKVFFVDEVINYGLSSPCEIDKNVDPRAPAVIIYSGGTTGVAKGIVLSHESVAINAQQIRAWGQLDKSERILAVLPLFHGFGMNVCMNSAILSGMDMVLLPRFDAREMAKTIDKYKPTLTAAVPTILVALSNLPDIEKYDFSSLKAIWVGAAALTKAIKKEFEDRAKCRVIEGYGLTEAVTAIIANPYHGKQKIGSIGLPFPDVDVKILSLDDGVTEMRPNQQGEIVIKTPTLMLGYYNKKDDTSAVVKDGWLYTGDIGYMDDEGYFYITDRKKDLIIVGGFNVFPREIEEVLTRHPKVKEGVAVGVPDKYKGEKIKIFIVPKDGEALAENEIVEYLRKHLAPYKIPKEVEFREDLPKSAIGKILRRVLREEEIKKQGFKDESSN